MQYSWTHFFCSLTQSVFGCNNMHRTKLSACMAWWTYLGSGLLEDCLTWSPGELLQLSVDHGQLIHKATWSGLHQYRLQWIQAGCEMPFTLSASPTISLSNQAPIGSHSDQLPRYSCPSLLCFLCTVVASGSSGRGGFTTCVERGKGFGFFCSIEAKGLSVLAVFWPVPPLL